MSKKAEDLAVRVISALNDMDYSQIEPSTTDDVELRFSPGRVFHGREGVREFARMLRAALPECTVVARKIHAGEDFAVVEWEAFGRTPTRRESEDQGVFVMELRDGRVARVNLYVDTAAWAKVQQDAASL